MLLKTLDGSKVTDWSNVDVFRLVLKIAPKSKNSNSKTMSVVRSIDWLAPEVKQAMKMGANNIAPNSKYSDIWSCGCVSLYLVKKRPPDNVKDVKKLKNDLSLRNFQFIDYLLCHFQHERENQLSAGKLLKHPFLTLPLLEMISESRRTGNFEQVNKFCSFKTTESLATFIESLKHDLSWNDEQIANFLMRAKLVGAKYLSEDSSSVPILSLFQGMEEYDMKHIGSPRLLTNSLVQAAGIGLLDIIKWLCESGTGVNGTNSSGKSALYLASSEGCFSTVEYLVKEIGADVNSSDANLVTALQRVVIQGHSEIVKLLCESGTEVDKRNLYGRTALYYASANAHVSIVEILLDINVDETITDNQGVTAQEVAGSWCYDPDRRKEIRNFWENRSAGKLV